MTPSAGSGSVSNDVLAERIDSLTRQVEHLADNIAGLSFVHPETLDTKLMLQDAHRNELERRVGALEAANQWLWRTVGGILLTALLVGLLTAAGFPK